MADKFKVILQQYNYNSYKIFKASVGVRISLEKSISLEALATKHEITGANIVNIIQYACLQTIAENRNEIQHSHLLDGIKKEYQKEGKSFNL